MTISEDCIHISGIRAYGFTGLFPEEKALGQWFEVDLTLWLDLGQAAESDRIEDTYNYVEAVNQIRQVIKEKDYALIERLAERVAEVPLVDKRVRQVRVRLVKVSPPIPDFSGKVAVEITRPRQ
jgi:dihydroneopterin aldolase